MAKKGIYQRYESIAFTRKEYEQKRSMELGSGHEFIDGYTQYTFNKETGTFSGSNSATLYLDTHNKVYRVYEIPSHQKTMKIWYVTVYGSTNKLMICYQVVTTQEIEVTDYKKGTYLTDIIADYGSLPADGRHSDGYWYVFVKMASDLKGNDNGFWRDTPEGWSNVNGVWKPQNEFKANVNGIYR